MSLIEYNELKEKIENIKHEIQYLNRSIGNINNNELEKEDILLELAQGNVNKVSTYYHDKIATLEKEIKKLEEDKRKCERYIKDHYSHYNGEINYSLSYNEGSRAPTAKKLKNTVGYYKNKS